MASAGSATVPYVAAESETNFLEADAAREILFNKILDQLAASSLFSNSTSAPNIFVVYAHNNKKEGAAYDECVRKLITWLRKIHARVLSDQSPLPPLNRRIEGDEAIRNILANQLCLLPPKLDCAGIPTVTSVDKVIVCGSEVLEQYCEKPSALSYIGDIVHIYHNGRNQSTTTLQSRIHDRVESECNKDDFHHILTELAFLEVRRSDLPQAHGMIPVLLSQINADEAPLRYLSMFDNTDVKLKLKSPTASSLHKLCFKLLEQLFPDDKDFIRPFKDCYASVSSTFKAHDEAFRCRQKFDAVVNQQITRAYQEYWSLFCVLVRDEKLQAYSGKLSDRISKVLETTDLRRQHEILRWLSPTPAAEYHGRFQDSGTARMEGTCDWIIKDENLRRWYTSNGSALLFLRGDMGMGKTYSTSRVVDWIKQGLSTNDNHEAFAYFYCNKQDPMRRTPKDILRNIIRQMATGPWREGGKGEIVHKTVHELWKRSQGPGISSTFAEWSTCLLKLIDTYPRTTIVLDAFDECEKDQRQDLIKLFKQLAARNSEVASVKLFISTRPEEDVLQHFDKYPAIRIKGEHNADDIASFVRTKIAEHGRWSRMPEDFQAEVIQTLLKKSEDMFLFASLQIQHLLLCRTQPALKDRLGKLPDSLEKTYEKIYQSAPSDPDEKNILDRALKWVMCSARPLSTKDLLLAICQDSESDGFTEQRAEVDEELILVLGQNLLCLEGDNDAKFDEGETGPVWRLAHQAVAEFFENKENFKADIAHYEVGTVCLMILLDTFGEEPALSWSSPEDDDSETGGDFVCPCEGVHYIRIDEYKHGKMKNSLVEYAIWAWPTHVRAQEHREASSVVGLSQKLQEFFGGPEKGSVVYERWIRHLLSGKDRRYPPEWSIFRDRYMPDDRRKERNFKPISLACYLGFYTTLAEWWDQTTFDENLREAPGQWNPWGEHIPAGNAGNAGIGQLDYARRWSLVALACAHGETKILKRLLECKANVNTTEQDEIPPIVVAVLNNSVDFVEHLLQHGGERRTLFGIGSGHVLFFAIRFASIEVTEMLLTSVVEGPREVEEALHYVSCNDIWSADLITLLLNKDVDVNTRLRDGTLLAVAAHRGWEDLVRRLLNQGADVNKGPVIESDWERQYWFRNALEAALMDHRWSIAHLLIEHGARVTSRTIVWLSQHSAARIQAHDVLQLPHSPDLNEVWEDYYRGRNTSALIETVKSGDVDCACLLIQHGADVNLKVGGEYGDPLNTVFWAILDHVQFLAITMDYADFQYPTSEMIKVLHEAGATLETLERNCLNTALTASAYAGLEDNVRYFLARGASPNTFCAHGSTTALGAAAASQHSRASYIIRILIDHGADINLDFSAFGDHEYLRRRLALDFPFLLLICYNFKHQSKILDNLLQSAYVLLSEGAIWDIDFSQWRKCLETRHPEFASNNAGSLDQLLQMLKKNRHDLFVRDPGAVSDDRWRIKDIEDANQYKREVLNKMQDVVRMGR